MAPPIPSSFRQTLDGRVPMSLAELAAIASSAPHTIHISSNVPLQRYINGAETLRKQAAIDAKEKRDERAFVSLVKCAKLLLELLPSHPEYRSLDATKRKVMRDEAQAALDELGIVKGRLATQHEAYRANPTAFEPGTAAAAVPAPPTPTSRQVRAAPASLAAEIPFVPSQRSGMGFDVRDILGWGVAKGQQQQRFPHASEQRRPQQHQPPARDDSRLALPMPELKYPTLRPSHSIRMSKHQTVQGFAPSSEHSAVYFQTVTHSSQPALRMPDAEEALAEATRQALRLSTTALPANIQLSKRLTAQDVEREAREFINNAQQYRATSFTEGGEELRALHIPSSLISRFVSLADSNTRNNIETVALLMGRLTNDTYFVSHLVLPRQTGSADRCDTEDEEGIWEFQTREDLICVGWIHTHPAWSCFLSSRDLHTHATFQALMPEAVAIVCAPNSEPNVGIFRLTAPDPGLSTILNCRAPGDFHPHVSAKTGESMALYTDVSHVVLNDHAPLDVADLRSAK